MKHEINVPEGCKVISVETTDDMVVVKFEKEEPEFKENDIVYTEHVGYGRVSILKNSDFLENTTIGYTLLLYSNTPQKPYNNRVILLI